VQGNCFSYEDLRVVFFQLEKYHKTFKKTLIIIQSSKTTHPYRVGRKHLQVTKIRC